MPEGLSAWVALPRPLDEHRSGFDLVLRTLRHIRVFLGFFFFSGCLGKRRLGRGDRKVRGAPVDCVLRVNPGEG